MVDTMDELIKEISIKHGITVGRDDPIMVLQTLNAHIIKDNVKAQNDLLHQYKEELEEIYMRWGNEAKEKAEKILNASLSASKEAMANLLSHSAEATTSVVKKEVSDLLLQTADRLNNTKQIAILNLTASAVTFLAVFGLILPMIFR